MPDPLDDFLARIYAAVPDIGCKGLCADTCHDAIPVYGPELAHIIARVGPLPAPRRRMVCPALGTDGRCGIYDLRPLICRVHGTVEPIVAVEGFKSWVCPHGCRPERQMTAGELLGLFSQFDQFTIRSMDPDVDAVIEEARAGGDRVFAFAITPEGVALGVYPADHKQEGTNR